ncbi:MAG: hypothetical protein M0P13_03240 [Fibrobacteraceae bacterium]|nr:hypothetical protein [Fibrobacteraceae bacterium]
MIASRLLRTFFFCFGIFFFGMSSAASYNQNGLYGLKYGPNLAWSLAGNTPFVWGQWLPQATGNLSFDWIEPLNGLPYGNDLDSRASFLRFNTELVLSPFYGGFRMGLGIRPFQANPQIETRFVYENYTYFNSNVEMTLSSNKENGNIADSWTADWITNRLYSNSSVDYMQNFAFWLDLDYSFGNGGLLGGGFHYTLVDVNTSYEGKSYDYTRNIPVFSRDFILDFILYGCFPVHPNWALSFYLLSYNTGYSRSSAGTYLKEPLSYALMLLGPSFTWDKKLSRATLMVGFWEREKKRYYKGRLSQQFLIHLQYQRNFDFPVAPVPQR